MRIAALVGTILILSLWCGCGGGGGGGPQLPHTTVSGTASLGPFQQGSTVRVFALAAGQQGTLLAQSTVSDAAGSYSADLGGYSGPILVQVSGSYLDEATGGSVALPEATPLRAALPVAQGVVSLPVTALTELAVRQAGTAPSAAQIASANALVSSAFKVDIVATQPVVPERGALAGASQAQLAYTLALAAISQLARETSAASDQARLQAALGYLSRGISASGLAGAAANGFREALNDFVTGNPNNHTGIASALATDLVGAGSFTKSYTLSLPDNLAAGLASGVQFEVSLPAGVTVQVDAENSALQAQSLALTGNVAANSLLGSHYTSGSVTIAVLCPQGLRGGSLATLTCSIPSGSATPAAAEFVIGNVQLVDGTGKRVTGAGVTVTESPIL